MILSSRFGLWSWCLLAGPLVMAAQAQPAGTWLVVPFEVKAPTTRTFWLGEGAAVLVGEELTRLGLPIVPRAARVEALDSLRLPTSVTLTRATSIRVAELLGAYTAVFGEVSADETTLTVRAQRLWLETGRLEPEVAESGRLMDLVPLCERVAERLIGATPQSAGTPRRAADSLPLEAFEAYVKALLTERPEARVRLLDVARARAPAYDPARLALWDAYTALGDHATALRTLDGIDDKSPVLEDARFKRALSLIELPRYDEAFATLRTLADARPSAAVFNNLGVVQLRRGSSAQTGRATYYFNQAVEREPDAADLLFNLGYAYWAERDPQATIYWLREALRRNPVDPDAHAVLAAALEVSDGEVESARERRLAGQLSSRYAEAGRRAGDAVPRGLERIQDSLTTPHGMRYDVALTAAAQKNQEELVAFHLERGQRLFDQHLDGDAEPELRRVLFLAPYHAGAHLLVGRICLRSGRVREATAAFHISLWSEESVAAHVALAEAYLESRDHGAARASVQRALELDPASGEARALLARIDAAGR